MALSGRPLAGAGQVAIILKGSRAEAVTGRVVLEALVGSGLDAYLVEFYVDGRFKALTNVAPYRASWNADRYDPGVHTIRVIVRDRADQEIASQEATVIVSRPQQD